MPADINTTIIVNGTKDQLIAFYKAAKRICEEKLQQYRTQRDCYYFDICSMSCPPETNKLYLQSAAKDTIERFLSSVTDTLLLEISGPYGCFNGIDELAFFEPLAEAVPDCKFTGRIEGFDPGGTLLQIGELEAGILTLKYLYCDDEEDWDDEDFDEEDCDDEDFDEEEPVWDEIAKYDPLKKKYIK